MRSLLRKSVIFFENIDHNHIARNSPLRLRPRWRSSAVSDELLSRIWPGRGQRPRRWRGESLAAWTTRFERATPSASASVFTGCRPERAMVSATAVFWLQQIQRLAQDLVLQRLVAEQPLQLANPTFFMSPTASRSQSACRRERVTGDHLFEEAENAAHSLDGDKMHLRSAANLSGEISHGRGSERTMALSAT